MPRSTKTYGLDTSVFVRLLTGHPEADFERTVKALKKRHEANRSTEFVVSNQVVGEAYITLQHFYKISKADAREAMLKLFDRGSLRPLNGQPVLQLLQDNKGAGLVDRLIAQDYAQQGAVTLTNDKKMTKLDGVERL